ncbi:MAG TPA: YhjD/YihY/BrkB family envelope integrity protein [Jiangellales bacterium]|nr:YhjD/YihY/BrkB family envelope integrity protein [Jiangellales bacterium]
MTVPRAETAWSDRLPPRLRPLAARLERTRLGTLVSRTATGLVRIEPFDRAMTLAAQAFTSVLPVVIVIAVLRPGRPDEIGDTVAQQLGLPPTSRQVLVESLPEAAEASASFGVIGVLVVVVSATSFSRALERMYARIWDVARPGIRGAWRWLAVLVAVVLALVVIRFTQSVLAELPYSVLWRTTRTILVWAVVWTLAPWLLMRGQVAARLLVAGGVVTGVGMGLLGLVGAVYLPIALTSSAQQFGALGVAFTYIGWLFVVSMVVVVGAVLGHAAARDEGRLGRVLRGRHHHPGPVGVVS